MRRRLHALRQSRGFTVVELLTTMVILGIVLGSVVTIFVSTSNAQVDANRRFQAQQNARMALERMRREVHCASAVTATAWPASRVVLTLPAGCPGAAVATDVTWCTRVIAASRNGLYRIAGNGAGCVGGSEFADYLTVASPFTYSAPAGRLATLGIDFTVDLTPADVQARWRLTDNLVLRNDTR